MGVSDSYTTLFLDNAQNLETTQPFNNTVELYTQKKRATKQNKYNMLLYNMYIHTFSKSASQSSPIALPMSHSVCLPPFDRPDAPLFASAPASTSPSMVEAAAAAAAAAALDAEAAAVDDSGTPRGRSSFPTQKCFSLQDLQKVNWHASHGAGLGSFKLHWSHRYMKVH